MKALHWITDLLSAAPMVISAEIEEGRRKRSAASAKHAVVMVRSQTRALDIIDRQDGNRAPVIDAIEALMRGEPKE